MNIIYEEEIEIVVLSQREITGDYWHANILVITQKTFLGEGGC